MRGIDLTSLSAGGGKGGHQSHVLNDLKERKAPTRVCQRHLPPMRSTLGAHGNYSQGNKFLFECRSFTLPKKLGHLLGMVASPRPSVASRADTPHIGRHARRHRFLPEASQWRRCSFRYRIDTPDFPCTRAPTIVQTCFGPLSILHSTSRLGKFRSTCGAGARGSGN
jgi:hypothetical protein